MTGLTVLQPFASCIAYYGKDVENRSWPAPGRLLFQDLAIHAGKKWDEAEAEYVESRYGFRIAPEHHVTGAVVCVVCVCGNERVTEPRGWSFGPWAWRLTSLRVLPEPVPCRGFQGLWKLPPDVEAKVRAQLGGG